MPSEIDLWCAGYNKEEMTKQETHSRWWHFRRIQKIISKMLYLLFLESIVVKYLSEHIFSYISLPQSYLILISKVPKLLNLCMLTYTIISFLDSKARNWHEDHFRNLRLQCILISCKDILQIKLADPFISE